MRSNPALRTQRIVLAVVQVGVLGAFLWMAVIKWLREETGVAMICTAGALYSGFRAFIAVRSALGKYDTASLPPS